MVVALNIIISLYIIVGSRPRVPPVFWEPESQFVHFLALVAGKPSPGNRGLLLLEGGVLENNALTNGFLHILKLSLRCMFAYICTLFRFFNPSNEILLFLMFQLYQLSIMRCKMLLVELAFSR